jgi:hypothetical protein
MARLTMTRSCTFKKAQKSRVERANLFTFRG